MNIRRHVSTLLLLLCITLVANSAKAQIQVVGDGGPGPVKAQHLTAELVSLAPTIDHYFWFKRTDFDLIRQAIASQPNDAAYHLNLASALQRLGIALK